MQKQQHDKKQLFENVYNIAKAWTKTQTEGK